jgi:hypothetical protein
MATIVSQRDGSQGWFKDDAGTKIGCRALIVWGCFGIALWINSNDLQLGFKVVTPKHAFPKQQIHDNYVAPAMVHVPPGLR